MTETTAHNHRYLYVKNGDVIEQLRAINSLGGKTPHGGPNAFLADFLKMIDRAPLRLLSHSYDCKSDPPRLSIDNIRAKVFTKQFRMFGKPGRAAAMINMFFRSLFTALCFRPDRILCGATGPLLWTSFITARLLKAPLIYSGHNRIDIPLSGSLLKKILRAIDLWTIRRATAVICHGPYLHRLFIDLGVDVNRIIEFDSGLNNFITKNTIAEQNSLRKNGVKSIIMYIGRIEMDKGVMDLLNASASRLRSDQSLRLVYIGAGRALDALEKRVAQHGIKDRVVFLGRIPHNKIGAFLQQADVLVTPTQSSFPEGRCMVVMEGFAAGVPVISPDFGPFPFLVNNRQNGLLYRPDSVKNLKKSLDTLLDNETFRKKLAAGAKKSAEQLLVPPVKFSQALQKAFAYDRKQIKH